MEKLIGIYDANGGLWGELKYVFSKIILKKHCALCDITHGMSVKPKAAWQAQAAAFPIRIETLHMNEVDPQIVQTFKADIPCIIHLKDGQARLILGRQELSQCHGEPTAFFQLLQSRFPTQDKD